MIKQFLLIIVCFACGYLTYWAGIYGKREKEKVLYIPTGPDGEMMIGWRFLKIYGVCLYLLALKELIELLIEIYNTYFV